MKIRLRWCLLALGDALIGERLSGSLGLARNSARDMAERQLEDGLERLQSAEKA